MKGKCSSSKSYRIALSYLVLFAFGISLVIFGCSSYFLMWHGEDKIFHSEYKATASELTEKILSLVDEVVQGGSTLATIAGTFYPSSSDWPYAHINGFTDIVSEFKPLLVGGVFLLPIVYPDNVDSFERYAKSAYGNDRDVPKNAGYHEFGFGIYARNQTTGERYHDVLGDTDYGSLYQFLTPMLSYVDNYNNSNYLYNPHADDALVGKGLESVFDCAQSKGNSCQAILESDNSGNRPGSIILTPIYPRNDQSDIVGYMITVFIWDLILRGSVAEMAEKIDLVVSTANDEFTCKFHGGNARIDSFGDSHDARYDDMVYQASFSLEGSEANVSTMYTFRLYPTYDLYSEYHTLLPVKATILSVSMIMVTVILFLVYDRYVKYDREETLTLLDSKRRFMRYISHEIRTPLNILSMGLQLMEDMFESSSTDADTKKAVESTEDKVHCSLLDGTTAPVPPAVGDASGALNDTQNDDLIQTTAVDTVQFRELLDEVRKSANVALDVLNDLLHYDKIETGNLKYEISIVDIWTVLSDSVDLFATQALASDIAVVTKSPLTDAQSTKEHKEMLSKMNVLGDYVRLSQSFRNLISNALKFSPAGSVINISLTWNPMGLASSILPVITDDAYLHTAYTRSGSLLVQVTDQGPGLSAAELGELFGEGVQFHANKLQAGGGSGLGLCISKSIMEFHGGQIWAKSGGHNCGTTFGMELPLVQMKSDTNNDTHSPLHSEDHFDMIERGTPKSERTILRSNNILGKTEDNYIELDDSNDGDLVINTECGSISNTVVRPRLTPTLSRSVLVVDDTALNRKMMCRLLKSRGYVCETASDGIECVERLERMSRDVSGQGQFGIIAMDFQMPKMTGPEATERIRSMGLTDIVIIGVTGNVMADDRALFLSAGADAVLSKPLDIKEFEDITNRFR